jgi:uncharacterized protein (TIGR02687 family)
VSSGAARIQSVLLRIFERQRVVFWYDACGEWWTEVEALELPEVEKVTVQNNEFGIKHRIAREAAGRKFLLYFPGQGRPEDHENWLLDQLLAHGPAFSPDRASLALLDAGLPLEYKGLAEEHLEFFRTVERVAKLREVIKPDDDEREVRLKMMAVICRSEPSLMRIVLTLVSELARDRREKWALMEKAGLVVHFWVRIAGAFGYQSGSPALLDFVLAIFRSATPFGGPSALDFRQALTFLNRWKDSQEHQESYLQLSERAGVLLNVSASLNQIEDIQVLAGCDAYRLIELRILAALRDRLLDDRGATAAVRKAAAERLQMFWARRQPELNSAYRAIMAAGDMLELGTRLELTVDSFDGGLRKYAGVWFRMDQHYRKFVQHLHDSGQAGLFEKLAERIEGLYTNEYLGTLALRWQEWVDRCERWESGAMMSQRRMFAELVLPQLSESRKVFVIVTDALRFEAGQELLERILCEDRWNAELHPMLGSLPSFTQLGMAALLPHEVLEMTPGGQTVAADGQLTVGLEARAAILGTALNGRATAVTAEALMAMNSKTEGRDLARAHDVVYVYHNTIDATGDKRDTEQRTCAAVESAFDEILKLLRKAAAMNVSHFVVTADHGFLFQNEPLAESDFLAVEVPDGTLKYDRRFLIAPVIPPRPAWKVFSGEQLGLRNDLQFAFPKGIQRLRLQGSGSRYVHGGSSLQEIVVPAIVIKKERVSDVGRVGVDVLRSGQAITTGQVSLTFIQTSAVSEKMLPREVRAGFYAESGLLLSDTRMMNFDSTDADARQRERVERFIFSREAEGYNQQDIQLRLEELVPGTTHWVVFEQYSFRLRRAFESDFDEF